MQRLSRIINHLSGSFEQWRTRSSPTESEDLPANPRLSYSGLMVSSAQDILRETGNRASTLLSGLFARFSTSQRGEASPLLGSPRSNSSSDSRSSSSSPRSIGSSRSTSPAHSRRGSVSEETHRLRLEGESYGTETSLVNTRVGTQIENNNLISRVQAVWIQYKTKIFRKYTQFKEKIHSPLDALRTKVSHLWERCKQNLIAWKERTCLGNTLYSIGLGLAKITCSVIDQVRRSVRVLFIQREQTHLS